MSWNKTRFSQWEVEGEVRKRVETALAKAKHDRLASQSSSERQGPAAARLFSFLRMSLDRAAGRFQAGVEAVRVWIGAPLGLEEGGEGTRKSG